MTDTEPTRSRYTRLILASESWFPSYDRTGRGTADSGEPGWVKVRFIRLRARGLVVAGRVCVWGADDTGMEIDFVDVPSALELWERLIRMPVITKATLWNLGFRQA